MVPDPVCASCHGSFVEKIENSSDDPRNFTHDHGGFEGDMGDMPPGIDTLLFSLQSMMDRGMRGNSTQRTVTGPSFTFEVRGPSGSRTVRLGGSNTLAGGNGEQTDDPSSPNAVPNMSTFLRSGPLGVPQPFPGQDRPTITGPLMAQYLMALLGHRDPSMMFGGLPENGRMGDYVFNQEALDEIITQLMESNNAHRPVPAPEDVVSKLPREVLTVGSATLQQDCAVCKEQFKLETEDPDEQIVVTLPCKHPFHEPCIIPWLKSSGTCPVCRHALVPQPEHHSLPPQSPGSSGTRPGSGPSNQTSSGAPNRSPESGGLFHTIFNGLTGHGHGQNHNNRSSSTNNTTNGPRSPTSSSQQPHRRSSSDPSARQNRNTGHGDHLPGSWSEDLD